jgi:hypothetical protein
MLEPTFLLLCSKVIVDRHTGAMSLLELIDMVAPPPPPTSAPLLAPDFFIVSGWRRDDETRPLTFPVRFDLVDPSGQRLVLGEQQVKLDPNHLGVVAVRVAQLSLSGPGQHRIETTWRELHDDEWKTGPWAGLWFPPGQVT